LKKEKRRKEKERMLLSEKNKHERDSRISFIEEGHIYDVDGDRGYTSVTTFVHHFFDGFDAEKVLAKMENSRKKETSPYYGMTNGEILDVWEKKRNQSATMGTLMHQQIENFYNQISVEVEKIPVEWELFQNFNERFGKVPYRTEWYVFDEENRIAGSIDMMFRMYPEDNEQLIIVDWKRTEELKLTNYFQSGRYPLEHLQDCNFYHYCLQLNTYRYILQKHYGKKIVGMFLVVLHPNNETFIQKSVPVMEKEIENMMKERKNPKGRSLSFLRQG